MLSEKEKKSPFIVAFAIMSVYVITMSAGNVSAALASISAAFPNVPMSTIALISTLPSLLMIPASLIAGALAGNKVKYKTIIIIGMLFYLVGGLAPVSANSMTVILIERAIFGIGFGFITPMGNALVLSVYEGNKRATMLGIGSMVMNLGAIVMQFAGGALAEIGWQYSFYSHALGIVSLILVLIFLTEPPKVGQPAGAEKPKVRIRGGVLLTALLLGIYIILIFPSAILMSGFLQKNNLGGPAVAGMVLSVFTLGGMGGGFVYGPLFKAIKKYVVALGLLLGAVGYALVIYSGNIVLVAIGMAIAGASFSIVLPACYMIAGMIASPQEVALSTSVLLAAVNIFAFFSGYFISFVGAVTGDMLAMPMVWCMIGLAVASIVFIFVNPLPKPKHATVNE
ncbi:MULTISPECIES: MFS transporter [unclassified Dehalobacter]|uniref:MFS transporter n=1 Tax=unclassified Dehalobacter TaxID=2635733 RepID=UPI00037BD82C|nr:MULTISPECIES: MFS transporter [unclassified Dehalobacter]RJE48808.1 MFS transporter [Dehalobacter sp. MCB1]TCX51900.1 MFS transporter [Dehalobacter sp. 14DCB1]TCX52960.1 MFS transporter [Dehalobacter sp. 12DCB1]